MTDKVETDLCVLGGGPGGGTAAAAAAALGWRVILVEKNELGGAKRAQAFPLAILAEAGRVAATLRGAARFGIHAREPQSDFAQIVAEIDRVRSAAARSDSFDRLSAMNVKVMRTAGRFIRPDTLEAGTAAITARHFIVATGAMAPPVALPGIELVQALSSETVLGLKSLPSRLIVMGATRHGLSLAQSFRRLGSDVVVLDQGMALSEFDRELVEPLLLSLAHEGVDIREQVKILRVEPRPTGLRVILSGANLEMSVDGSHLFVDAPRQPAVQALGLEAARVRFAAAGIGVDGHMRTSNHRIFAIGDVTGEASAEAASLQAGVALRRMLSSLTSPWRADRVPRRVATDPQIATVGLDEEAARARHRHISVLRWPLAENDGARARHATTGHIKLIATKGGDLLGAGIVGAEAGELIGLFSLALSKGLTVTDLAGTALVYPSLAEASRAAVLADLMQKAGRAKAGLRFFSGLR